MLRVSKKDWFLVIGSAVLVGVIFLAVTRGSDDAVVGLLGVLIGAGITVGFQQFDARLQRKHQLRLAALDKRLQAHQEAFSLWREIWVNRWDPKKVLPVVAKCQNWWENNCLYLTGEARSAFARAYQLAALHSTGGFEANTRLEAEEEILRVADIIVRGVELPSIGRDEGKSVEPDHKNNDA